MKQKKTLLYVCLLILGLAAAGSSICLNGLVSKQVNGLLLGVGAGLFGMSISQLYLGQYSKKHPELLKKAEINQKDERAVFIRNKAKAMAGAITNWLLLAIAYILIIIDAPLWATLVTIAIFLLYHILGLSLMAKYEKTM